ncbi:MAG: serine protease AprX, partial [bacterium]
MRNIITLILVGLYSLSFGQDKIWVFFADKPDAAGFNPHSFFDQKAIDRRVKLGIDLYDITDVPVSGKYVKGVAEITSNNKAVSRWFNAMCCFATEEEKQQILDLPYVTELKTVTNIRKFCAGLGDVSKDADFSVDENEIEFLKAQTERMGASIFKANKVNGSGIRVAIFDVGFKSYKTNPAFNHVRANNRIIKTYNFVQNKEEVDNGGTHGTFVMSCVGGIIDGQQIGLATGAEFLLARTETWTEFYSEEENWLAAAEWADKNGADVINSSLGYTFHRYFKEDMDGQTSLVAKAANMAASKGIVVVNSAGNEGSDQWKTIGTPADADSVLSIGGIHPKTGIHTSFSSFGPTRDKRLKPNVTAYGHVIGSGPKGISETQGTSFSGPLVAGFVACAMQTRPGYSNMKIFDEILKSGDLYPYFDYAHGYGVPQAQYFFKMPVQPNKTFEIDVDNTSIRIELDTTGWGDGLKEGDHKIGERYITWPDYVFYHIENKKGYLDKYFVVNPDGGRELDEDDQNLIGRGTTSSSPLV